jgi:hypothetical protein
MRLLKKEESEVLEALLGMVPSSTKPPSEDELFAVDLADGGMGSIRLTDKSDRPRKMGRELVTAHYIDEDGVPVIISINLDQDGRLFEIDFWKVNYDPLKHYPLPEELHEGQPTVPKASA